MLHPVFGSKGPSLQLTGHCPCRTRSHGTSTIKIIHCTKNSSLHTFHIPMLATYSTRVHCIQTEHTHMYTCTHSYTCTHVHTHTLVHKYIYTCTQTYLYTQTEHTHTCTHVHVHTYTSHLYTRTHMHTLVRSTHNVNEEVFTGRC